MSMPLREPRDLRRVAPLSKQGGRDDNDIAAERAATEHTTTATAPAVTRSESTSATRAAKRRATWAAVDHTAEASSQRTCSTFNEQSVIAGYGATRAFSASTASAKSSRRGDAAERTAPVAFPLLGGAVMTSTPPPAWRTTLVTQQVLARRKPKRRLTRMRAIERIEWQLEELLVRDKRRITRQQLMTLIMPMPITVADAEYLLSGSTRTDRVLDRCFELMGEDRNDAVHDNRAVGEK